MTQAPTGRDRAPALAGVLAVLLFAVPVLVGRPDAIARAASSGAARGGARVCTASAGLTPDRVELRPTGRALGAAGLMELVFAGSPFGVTVSSDGRYVYDVRITVKSLRRREGAVYVAWAATPELDRVRRLGVLDDELRVSGRVDWNKFLVFVTEERSPSVDERWQGPVLLTGQSPSGLMHTMAGHGIFEDDPC